MRSFDDFKATVYARRDGIIAAKRKRQKIAALCIPAFICVVAAAFFIGGDMIAIKDSNMAYDEYYAEEDYENTIDTEDTNNGEADGSAGGGNFSANKEDSAQDNAFAVSSDAAYDDNGTDTNAVSSDTVIMSSIVSNSYVSVMSARIEVRDGETASMCLINDEEEAKKIEQLIKYTGALDAETPAPTQDITVTIRKETTVSVYYYYGDGREVALEGASPISAQVAAGILEFLESR